MGTKWKKRMDFKYELLYVILYALSFSTLFIWIRFPFDIFLINMILFQLPSILLTGSTFHGYLSGKKQSIITKLKKVPTLYQPRSSNLLL